MTEFHLLKSNRSLNPVVLTPPKLDDEDVSGGVRCPLCNWRPSRADRWSCGGGDGPEPFTGCGTVWNTFSTRGLCPGCSHQWHWTSCLQCGGWSLHDDWYTE